MSYCTIEEAWGLSEPFSSSKEAEEEDDHLQLQPQPQPQLQEHKKKSKKKYVGRKKQIGERKHSPKIPTNYPYPTRMKRLKNRLSIVHPL